MPDAQEILELCGLLERGEIDSPLFFERFTRAMTALIGCSRAGVWMFVGAAADAVLRCIAMYDATQGRMVPVADIVNARDGLYFEALLRDDCMVAPHARSHAATIGFLDDYLLPLDIHSRLDVGFSVNGQLFGTFSCEQIGAPMVWTQRQLQLLRQIASRASLTLMHAATATVDTAPGALWESSGPNRYRTMPLASGPSKGPAKP